jgi:hypothetical protein
MLTPGGVPLRADLVFSRSASVGWFLGRAAVVHDVELANCVDSYLRFRARPHDADAGDDPSNEDEELARRVLLLFLRWCALCAPPTARRHRV